MSTHIFLNCNNFSNYLFSCSIGTGSISVCTNLVLLRNTLIMRQIKSFIIITNVETSSTHTLVIEQSQHPVTYTGFECVKDARMQVQQLVTRESPENGSLFNPLL